MKPRFESPKFLNGLPQTETEWRVNHTVLARDLRAGVHHRSIGFVADERRINVGITRARCALLIIGHAASLAVDQRWRNLVKSAVDRDVMFQPVKPYNDYMQQVCATWRSCNLCCVHGVVLRMFPLELRTLALDNTRARTTA